MRFPLIICSLPLLLLASCGPSSVRMQAQGVAPMNLNEAGETTAVQIVCFALKSDTVFRTASVDALWREDRATLGDTLLGEPVAAIITPAGSGESAMPVEVPTPDGTAFIGVLAKFQKPDARNQRTLLIPVGQASGARLKLTGSSIELVK